MILNPPHCLLQRRSWSRLVKPKRHQNSSFTSFPYFELRQKLASVPSPASPVQKETFSCSPSADHQSPPPAVRWSMRSRPLIRFKCMHGASLLPLASREGDHLGRTCLLMRAGPTELECVMWGPVLCRALCHRTTTLKSKSAHAELLQFRR